MLYSDHKNSLKLTSDDTILQPLIIINNVTFNICEICEMYIHHKKCDRHIKSNCISSVADLPLNYLKGRTECISSQVLKNEENYITHLESKTHKTKLNKYIKYMDC